MACIERASPALKQILLKLYSSEKPLEIDHHLHEFGSVEYHILSQPSDPLVVYLSISTPPLCPGVLPNELSSYTIEMVKGLCPRVVEIAEATREGYQLTLRLNLNQIPRGKDYTKVIREISTVQSVILSSQLKEILWNVKSDNAVQGMYKPIKLVYNPREPFFVIRQPQRIVAVFPIRFKEKSDVIIATAFFQELVDVESSDKWAKAPPCTWSAIPPPELRGEAFEDLSTNGGFVSFDISSHHVDGKRLDKTVWNLLNFNAYVRYHVKTTKGFIQRRMRKRMENLVKVLHQTNSEKNEQITPHQGQESNKSYVEAYAIGRNIRMSADKARRVIDQIRGRSYEETLTILELMPYRACEAIIKIVFSAGANASNNLGLSKGSLIISKAEVNEGRTMKRIRPQARGRAYTIRKRTCHIAITVRGLPSKSVVEANPA